jgi:tetratricopeptide (TPR) repeat protein
VSSERAKRASRAMLSLSEQDFREFVSKLLKGMGLATRAVRTSGQTVEFDATLEATGEPYLVVATREHEDVRPGEVQRAVERMRKARVPKGVFITTGSVSREAGLYAEQFELAIADGEKLGLLLEKFGLDDEVDRKAARAFLDSEGDRSLPSMGKLEATMKWGNDFYGSGNYRKAIEYFQKASELKPNYDVAYTMMGNSYNALGHYDRAVECFEEALERNPESEEGWYNLGATLYHLGKFDDELACYDKALQLNKTFAKAWNNKGATLLQLGKDEEAVYCFDQALKSEPSNDGALSNRGVALRHLGRGEQALASFDRAIAANPGNLDAWLNRGLLLQEVGKFLEAVKCYDMVLDKVRSAEMLAQKTSALVAATRFRAALDSIDLALQLRPGWDVALELKRKAEEGLAKEAPAPKPEPVEMVSRIEPAPEVTKPPVEVAPPPVPEPSPKPAEPFFNSLSDFAAGETEEKVIYTCSECGAEVGAKDNFCIHCGTDLTDEEEEEAPAGEPEELERIEESRLVEEEELEFEELAGLGELCLRLGLHEDAVGRLGKALLLKDDASLHRLRGHAMYALGHYGEAVGEYELALDLDPDDVSVAWSRVEALAADRRFSAANEGLEALQKRAGSSAALLLFKSETMRGWGRRTKAIEALDEATETAGHEDLWNLEGATLAAEGKHDDALLCLDKAVQLDPGLWEAWCNRAATLAIKGELDQAISYYDRALDLEEGAVAALVGKATVLSEQGRADEALELIGEALTETSSEELLATKGFLLLEADRLDEALATTDAGLKVHEESPVLWNLKGLVARRKGDAAEAVEAFEEAVSIEPGFADAQGNLEAVKKELLGKQEGRARKKSEPKAKEKKGGIACPKCGEDNELGARACPSCGAKLGYKVREDALVKEMEVAIASEKRKGPPKKSEKMSKDDFIKMLMAVPGIGYAKASDLWEAGFRSEEDVLRAEVGELTRVRGITPGLARKLKKGL